MAESASNTDYLLEYTESIASLPAELKKNLALLGELDAKLKGMMQQTTFRCLSLGIRSITCQRTCIACIVRLV